MDEKLKPYLIAKDIISKILMRIVGNLLYAYNGHCYEFCDDDKLNRLIFEIGFKNNPDNATPKMINDVARLIKMMPEITKAIKPENKLWIFKNMTVDPITEKTYDLSYKRFSTVYINSDYIEKAGDTSYFDKFLKTVTDDDNKLSERFLQALGYILSPNLTPGRFVYIESKSSKVRSLTGKLIKSFFPENIVCSIDLYDMGNSFQVFSLNCKKLNINMNISSGVLNCKNTRISWSFCNRYYCQFLFAP